MRDYHHNWLDEQGFPSNFRGGGYKSNWIISDIERCMSNGPDFYFFCTIYPVSTWELPTNNSKFIAKQSKYVLIKSYVDVFALVHVQVLYHWTFKYTVNTTRNILTFAFVQNWTFFPNMIDTSLYTATILPISWTPLCLHPFAQFHNVLAWFAVNYNSTFLYYPRRQVITPCNNLSIEQLRLNKYLEEVEILTIFNVIILVLQCCLLLASR